MIKVQQLQETISYIKNISQQNQSDMLDFQVRFSLDDQFNKFLFQKMRILQQVSSISLNAIEYLQSLKEQKDSLEKTNVTMKEDLNNLCLINSNLQDQIEILCNQLSVQKQQVTIASKKQQLLQLQKSMIRKQLQHTKSKLEQRPENNDILECDEQNIQNADHNIITGSGTQIKSKKIKDLEEESILQEDENEYKFCNQSLQIIRKQLAQLRQATNTLRKKVSDQDRISKTSIKSLKSHNLFFSKLPSLKLKTKFSQQSLNSISFHRHVDENIWRVPHNLNEELQQLNLASCNSIYQSNQNQIGNQQRKPQLFEGQTDSLFSGKVSDNFVKVSNHGMICEDVLKSLNPQKTGKVIKIKSKESTSVHLKKAQQEKEEQKQSGCIRILYRLHQYGFNKIVRDRIQPRRAIRKFKRQQQQRLRQLKKQK